LECWRNICMDLVQKIESTEKEHHWGNTYKQNSVVQQVPMLSQVHSNPYFPKNTW
jgi:hypothetical protein